MRTCWPSKDGGKEFGDRGTKMCKATPDRQEHEGTEGVLCLMGSEKRVE